MEPIINFSVRDFSKCSACKGKDFPDPKRGRASREVVMTSCKHFYHSECITRQLKTNLNNRVCQKCHQFPLPLVRQVSQFVENSPFCEVLPLQVCRSGQVDNLRRLLTVRSDFSNQKYRSAVSERMVTLLCIAAGPCVKNNNRITRVLLGANANINGASDSGNTPLHVAAEYGRENVIKTLLGSDKEADINAINEEGESPLHMAAKNGNKIIIDLLHEAGADINLRDSSGAPPLHSAAQYGNAKAVKKLCSIGADINGEDRTGKNALHVAAQYGKTEIIEKLCSRGGNLHFGDQDGNTPLHTAVLYGHFDTVKVLQKSGADIGAVNRDNVSPLHIAARTGSEDIVKFLLKKGATPDVQENLNSSSPLHEAVQGGHLHVVKLLIQNQANCNLRQGSGDTPLHTAVKYGDEQMVKTLVKGVNPATSRADTNIPSGSGVTPLHIAAAKGLENTVKILILEGNAEPDIATVEKRNTPLHFAVNGGHCSIVNFLLGNKGVCPDAVNSNNETPLFIAVKKDYKPVIGLLLQFNADPNVRCKERNTVLHIAVERNDKKMVQTFLKYGADPNIRNLEGVRPQDIATWRGYRFSRCDTGGYEIKPITGADGFDSYGDADGLDSTFSNVTTDSYEINKNRTSFEEYVNIEDYVSSPTYISTTELVDRKVSRLSSCCRCLSSCQ